MYLLNLHKQVPEEEEEEPPPPPIATRPERTKSIYTKPVEDEANANGAAFDTNRNPQAAPPAITPAPPIIPPTTTTTTTTATIPAPATNTRYYCHEIFCACSLTFQIIFSLGMVSSMTVAETVKTEIGHTVRLLCSVRNNSFLSLILKFLSFLQCKYSNRKNS